MIINRKKSSKMISQKWLTLLSKPFTRSVLFFLTCVVLFCAVFLLYRLNPFQNPFVPACSFYSFTNLYCPGCGMTRALHAVLHGHPGEAFAYNVMWPLLLLFVIGSFSLWFQFLITGKSPFQPVNRLFGKYPSIGWIIVILLFSFWIMRNIPGYPFTLLAPGGALSISDYRGSF